MSPPRSNKSPTVDLKRLQWILTQRGAVNLQDFAALLGLETTRAHRLLEAFLQAASCTLAVTFPSNPAMGIGLAGCITEDEVPEFLPLLIDTVDEIESAHLGSGQLALRFYANRASGNSF